MIVDIMIKAGIASLLVIFLFSVFMYAASLQSIMECVADLGPVPDVRDYCEAFVEMGREWK